MTKNTALTELRFVGNQLTADGLNTLLGMLHSNASGKAIYIFGNPGTSGCDHSIAIDKDLEVK